MVPDGEVIDQSPDPGIEVAVGARVILFVSTGPAVEEVPDLSNRPVLDAMNIVSKLGWQASTMEERSRTVPIGQVVRTEPPAHSELAPGSTLLIVVSSGLQLVPVPPGDAHAGAHETGAAPTKGGGGGWLQRQVLLLRREGGWQLGVQRESPL